MTENQRRLLDMCAPEVVLQAVVWHSQDGTQSDKRNPHFDAAAQCVDHGWLVFVRDQEFGQSVYRITPAGADALTRSD